MTEPDGTVDTHVELSAQPTGVQRSLIKLGALARKGDL